MDNCAYNTEHYLNNHARANGEDPMEVKRQLIEKWAGAEDELGQYLKQREEENRWENKKRNESQS